MLNRVVKRAVLIAFGRGLSVATIAKNAGVSRQTVWRWTQTVDRLARNDRLWQMAIDEATLQKKGKKKVPTFRGYDGNRPRRKNQLDIEPVDTKETLTLRYTCKACGHRGFAWVRASDYYSAGFVLKTKCGQCGVETA